MQRSLLFVFQTSSFSNFEVFQYQAKSIANTMFLNSMFSPTFGTAFLNGLIEAVAHRFCALAL